MNVKRVAFATAVEGGLALGDPTGAHVVLSPTGVEYRSGGAVSREIAWAGVRALDLDAPASRSRRPGGVSVLLGAAAESVGLEWTPGLAPVTVSVEVDDERHDLPCDGYIGPGYWARHLDALEAAAHVLVTHPAARRALERPQQSLEELSAVTGSGHDARGRLAGTWGSRCDCPDESDSS